MIKEEAITILENGEWWEIISGVLPHNDAERLELREAVHVAISALRARQAPAKMDRSRWDGCDWCTGFCPEVTGDKHWDYRFCPKCGRPLTEEAWAELARRINDGATD